MERNEQIYLHNARASRVPLADRLSAAPTYKPIAPKPVLINFTRTDNGDRVKIFLPKVEATLKRLVAVTDILNTLDVEEQQKSEYRAFQKLVTNLTCLAEQLREGRLDTYERALAAQWQGLSWGLREIGKVSFKSLRHEFARVISRLREIAEGGYFDWL